MTVLVALAAASPAAAQDRFKDVWVTRRGRLVELSGSSMAILTSDNGRVEMPLDRILRIEAHGDSLRNGGIIGAAVMGGMTVFACQGFPRGSQCVLGMAFNTDLAPSSEWASTR